MRVRVRVRGGVDHRPLAAAEAPTPLGDGRGADRVERHERLGRALVRVRARVRARARVRTKVSGAPCMDEGRGGGGGAGLGEVRVGSWGARCLCVYGVGGWGEVNACGRSGAFCVCVFGVGWGVTVVWVTVVCPCTRAFFSLR